MDPRPCVNVADLWAWEPPGGPPREELREDEYDADLPPHPTAVPTIEKLRRVVPTPKRVPQLLVCHDYQGAFPRCDRWEGCLVSKSKPFLFTHWWHMDMFCYFGHKLVNIPPPSFTSLAHRHGVEVLGTISFAKKDFILPILKSNRSCRRTIEKLVQIMTTWQFEGWMVHLDVQLMSLVEVLPLSKFVTQLKKATKAANPRASVLWYNEVYNPNNDREREQNANFEQRFYNESDGILSWNASHDQLIPCSPKGGDASVYKVVDVNGEDVGWECHEAVAKAHGEGYSVALLDACWAVEAEENENADPEEKSFIFWSALAPVMNSRALDYFPFKTTFRNGISQDGEFFRLRDMDLMPNLALSNYQMLPSEHGLLIQTPGRHLLWHVKMQSNPDLRVKIKVEDGASVKIHLDRREMSEYRYLDEAEDGDDVDNAIELRPMTKECLQVRAIFVVTNEPDTLLSYFSAYSVPTEFCLY